MMAACRSSSSKATILRVALVLAAWLVSCHGFLVHPTTTASRVAFPTATRTSLLLAATTPSDDASQDRVDVVVFGVGDLRTDDHEGLIQALQHGSSSKVIPVVVLDSNTLQKIPGSTVHPYETASLLHYAFQDLCESLQQKFHLPLHVLKSYDEIQKLSRSVEEIHIHACDLGPADNAMAYGPYSYFQTNHDKKMQIHPWSCRLRTDPWKALQTLSDDHPTYAQTYIQQQDPIKPLQYEQSSYMSGDDDANGALDEMAPSEIPSIETLVDLLVSGKDNVRQDEQNTGLYGTHWGGLDPSTIGEGRVLELVRTYVDECKEDDQVWLQQQKIKRNPNSLEHAAMYWMKRDGTSTQHLLAGELMTRFLAAPLFFGTVSPRRLWHASTKTNLWHTSVLKTLAESKEWHSLLAARNIQTDPLYSSNDDNDSKLQYKYWRWHGFLCRYAHYDQPESDEQNILLIHGFGASGSQWEETMRELEHHEILAPDLIGFGQSEKPPLTYTQYLWESYASAFRKEIGHEWDSFVVGGNSIGGYTSMGVAADDAAEEGHVSASGARGSDKCAGVVLMNSAGQIKSRDEIFEEHISIAQVTSRNELPKCSPLPRSAARVFGNGLLWYLRPRIQSICKNLYPTNPSAVSETLVQGILRDSLDPGAIHVMISGSKLPPPRTANELLGAEFGSAESGEGRWKGPVLVAQGMLDPLNDAKTRASMLGGLREGITVAPIDAGHCPHDELPSDVARAIREWMQTTGLSKASEAKSEVASMARSKS